MEVESAEPSLVVFAQTYYHDWQATVDGQPAPLLRANHAFQAVPSPGRAAWSAGEYQDRAFEIGAAISIVHVAGCLISLRLMRERPRPYGPHIGNRIRQFDNC